MLRPYLCDYIDVYIVVKGKIDLLAAATDENDKAQGNEAFKYNAVFTSYISNVIIAM